MSNLPAVKDIRVVACPHPFRQAREEFSLLPGQSLLEILREIQPDLATHRVHVWVGDDYVPPELWAATFPLPGAHIFIKVAPRGPMGKLIGSIFVAIAAIVLSVVTYGALSAAGWGLWAGVGAGLVGMTVSFMGNIILNALIPPTINPERQSQLAGGQDSPTYSLSGGSNVANKYGPVPVILGKHKVYPNYGAEPYTEILGNDQYLRLLFVWGFGPLEIREMKIGDTALGEFEGVEVEHRNLTYVNPQEESTVYGDDPLTLYTNDVHEEQLSIYLEKDQPQVRTTQAGISEISVDITHPQGLYAVNSQGNRISKGWIGKIEYRRTGTAEWMLVEAIDLHAATASAVRHGWRWAVNPEKDPNAQYDVRLTGLEPEGSTAQVCRGYWTALRSIKSTQPLNCPQPLAVTALRIKASDQLSGIVQKFSGVAQTICLDWDAATKTWITRTTSNPASLARHAAQGPHRQEPFLDEELDLAKLQYWHEYCETQAWAYHKVIDYQVDFWEILAEVAAAGRAARTWMDSKLSVIIDEPQDFEVGPAFTPRNSNNYKFNLAYPDLPHAWRVAFKNELEGWEDDERVVLDDGYQIEGLDAWGNPAPGLPPATVFKQLPLQGITHPDLVFRHGRYHIAAARLRFEVHEFDAHAEHLVATRGDRIKYASDVILVGLAYGRVKTLDYEIIGYDDAPTFGGGTTFGGGASFGGDEPVYSSNLAGVTLDEPCPMEEGKEYCIRFSREDNSSLLCPVKKVPGSSNSSLQFKTPLTPADAWPQAGNIFMFGESGKESLDLVIKAIRPNSNLGAKLTAVAYDEAIYQADQGPIPPHDPKVSAPKEWWTPVISWIRSDGAVLWRAPDGSWQSRILVTFSQITALSPQIIGVEGQFWRSDSPTGPPYTAPLAPLSDGEISLMPVEDGVSYDIRLRYVKQDGSRGPWTAAQTHVVEGKTAPPADVTGFAVYQVREVVNFTWTKAPDLDIRGYELRYGAAGCDWTEAAVITEVMLATSFATPMIPPGQWDFLIKAVDTSGNYSENAARKAFKAIAFYQVLSQVSQAPLWAGTLNNLVRDPATGHLYPKDQNIPSGNDFDVFDNFVVNPYAEYAYEAPEIDLGADTAARAWARIYSELGKGEEGGNNPELLIDYRKEAESYHGFEGWNVGPFEGRYLKAKVRFLSAVGVLVLQDFQPVVDKSL